MLRALLTIAFVAATGLGQVKALEMNWALDKNEKLAYLNLWGKIEDGDDAKFRSVVTPLLKSGYLIFKVNLFTGGGSVQAAKGIADQIRLLQARTVAPTRFSDIVGGRPSSVIILPVGLTSRPGTASSRIQSRDIRGARVRAHVFSCGQAGSFVKVIMSACIEFTSLTR